MHASPFVPDSPDNRRLRSHVFPDGWRNPEPADRYNLVVLGAGSGGLVTAAGAAGLGARVALIERTALGGDCLNFGCVPSKALLAAARTAATVRDAASCGIRGAGPVHVDFPAVMQRLRRLRADIAPNDAAERFRGLGVDVFLGEGRFTGPSTVEVGGRTLRFAKAVIATGARAWMPSIPGLAESGALTNETVFALESLPARLAVLGAGPIGCELAQAFARLGSRVTLVEQHGRVLPREDPEASALVGVALERDGVALRSGSPLRAVRVRDGVRLLEFEDGSILEADAILVGAGRVPNVDGLGLEAAGVAFDTRRGVRVDARLRTSNPRVFAVGDVCLERKFTHLADASARLVIGNALFGGRGRHTDLLVPHCTYTDPELAQVGLREDEARAAHGAKLATHRVDFAHNDRALLEGHDRGFVKVHAVGGRIVGATIVGPHAGELISEVTLAMRAGINLGKLAGVIHPYPTLADAVRRTGDLHNRTRLTPWVKAAFDRWLRWARR